MQPEKFFPHAEKLSLAERQWMASRDNPSSPFFNLIGNEAAVEECEIIVTDVLGRPNHRASDLNIAWIGPPGVGKTTFARAIADALELPFIEADPQSIQKPEDVLSIMQDVFSGIHIVDVTSRQKMPLTMLPQHDGSYFAPSCVFFIDEIHQLGSLTEFFLRATAHNTHTFEGPGFRIDTRAIMWQFATTERGKLPPALDRRFMKIELRPYTEAEIAEIVAVHNADIARESPEACRLIAHYYHLVTSEALDAATRARLTKRAKGMTWVNAVESVRQRDFIDDFGLSRKRLSVLRALGQSKLSLATLANQAGVNVEELEKFILPPMRTFSDGIEPLIMTGPGGTYITPAGIRALDLRGIPNKGNSVLPKQLQGVA